MKTRSRLFASAATRSLLSLGAAVLCLAAPHVARAGLISSTTVGPTNAPNLYYLSLEFANGNYYNYTLRSTAATLTGFDFINTVDSLVANLTVTQTTYSFGSAVTGITIGSDANSGFVNNSYWTYWNSATANPAQWGFANDGESNRVLQPGQADAWVFGDGSKAPQVVSFAVPEPGSAWAVVGLACAGGTVAVVRRRRDVAKAS